MFRGPTGKTIVYFNIICCVRRNTATDVFFSVLHYYFIFVIDRGVASLGGEAGLCIRLPTSSCAGCIPT